MSLKSSCEGKIYRHIVLVVKYGDRWGALGLSRRPDLMGKDLLYSSLADLILDYKQSYSNNFHSLLKVKLGLPITHNKISNEVLIWKHVSINIENQDWNYVTREIDQHARLVR